MLAMFSTESIDKLHNIGVISASISTVLNNTHKTPIRLFVTRGAEMKSSEGIMQGDLLVMAMYALAITPSICKLRLKELTVKQVLFANDFSGDGRIVALRNCWQCLAKKNLRCLSKTFEFVLR